MSTLPRQLSDFVLAPGSIKQDYEDFLVEEIPLYEAGGSGDHTYFLVEKRGLSTMQAISDLARALNVRRRDIGYAGMKDARAVTRQWMSVEHVEPERVKELALARISILSVDKHSNKLRLGHLIGNRFRIRVRGTQTERLAEIQDALRQLASRGVPNYFGQQRFGGRGDTWKTGRAIVSGDLEEALDCVLGRPTASDVGNILRARKLYDKQQYAEASRAWPGMFCDERRALRTLAKHPGKKKRAFLAIDRSLRNFYISAYQSQMFNLVVAERLASGLQKLQPGDLAWLHANGAVFEVKDVEVEQARADVFEISPTGPLFGYRMTQPVGIAGEFEAKVLANEGLSPESFRSEKLRVKGARRPLRFQPSECGAALGADERGAYLELRFALPRGCYATSLLRELFTEAEQAGSESDGTADFVE